MSYTPYTPNSYQGGGLEVVPSNPDQPPPEVYHPPTQAARIQDHAQAYTTGHQQSYGQGSAPVDRVAQEPVRSAAHSPVKESYVQSPASPPQDRVTSAMATAPLPPPTYKKICGVRPVTFILALLLVLVIIIAAVAGGVGGSIAVRDAYDRGVRDGAEATITVTSTNSVATTVSPPEVTDEPDDSDDSDDSEDPIASPSAIPRQGFLALDCPNLHDQTQTVSAGDSNSRFRISCGTDHTENGNDNVDITAIPAWSIQDCMLACAAYSSTNSGSPCVAVTFNADLNWVDTRGGNCWLKSDINGDAGEGNSDEKSTFGEAIVVS